MLVPHGQLAQPVSRTAAETPTLPASHATCYLQARQSPKLIASAVWRVVRRYSVSFEGVRVGVIGGSIAGCAAAIALDRAGCDVEVFERTRGVLQDRGAGIVLPPALRDELIETHYLPRHYPSCPMLRRRWYLADGHSPMGRLLWDQPSAGAANNWGVLWRSLRSQLPNDRYHEAAAITGLEPADTGTTISIEGRDRQSFDLVVGADGYRSVARSVLHPDSNPSYAGYVLWRGNYDESRVTDRGPLDELDEVGAWATVCFDGGHGVFYMIPGFNDSSAVGQRRVNWAIYAPTPDGTRFEEPGSVASGQVGPRLIDQLWHLLDTQFPPWFAALVRHTGADEISIQPIYDQAVPTYSAGRLLLIGDAGTVTRPHTASGATKALQDARSIEGIFTRSTNLDTAIAAYDHSRSETGNALVALGRSIGAAQVEHTPNWATMTPRDFERWTTSTLSGQTLYFYGDDKN